LVARNINRSAHGLLLVNMTRRKSAIRGIAARRAGERGKQPVNRRPASLGPSPVPGLIEFSGIHRRLIAPGRHQLAVAVAATNSFSTADGQESISEPHMGSGGGTLPARALRAHQ
jgi:hypothetical protein